MWDFKHLTRGNCNWKSETFKILNSSKRWIFYIKNNINNDKK
jgi:hypothetical protein